MLPQRLHTRAWRPLTAGSILAVMQVKEATSVNSDEPADTGRPRLRRTKPPPLVDKGSAYLILGLWVSSSMQQLIDGWRIALFGCFVKRSVAVLVGHGLSCCITVSEAPRAA